MYSSPKLSSRSALFGIIIRPIRPSDQASIVSNDRLYGSLQSRTGSVNGFLVVVSRNEVVSVDQLVDVVDAVVVVKSSVVDSCGVVDHSELLVLVVVVQSSVVLSDVVVDLSYSVVS